MFTLGGCDVRAVYSIQREYSVVDSSSSQQQQQASAGDENSQQAQPPAAQPPAPPQQRKFVDLTANKFSGVGPISQEGVPIALRSVINQSCVCWHLLTGSPSINCDALKKTFLARSSTTHTFKRLFVFPPPAPYPF